jgi:transposase
VEIVDQLDLKHIIGTYRGTGSAAYHPATLVALLFCGYATGVAPSRKLAQATYDSVAFHFICVERVKKRIKHAFLPKIIAIFALILKCQLDC